MNDKRLEREKEYHNIAFSEGLRKSADKYYAIHTLSFNNLLTHIRGLAKDKNILEYGCGEGSQSFYLGGQAHKMTSIDISDYAIKNAQEKANREGLTHMSFIEMNAEQLEFPSDTFNVIFGNAIIHHLDLNKALPEIKRVLKTNGKAFFYEPLGHNPFINLYRKLTPRMRTIDEHPLLIKDLALINSYFDNVQMTYLHLFTLLTVPFRKAKFYSKMLKSFHNFDTFIFKIFPFLKRYAWYCIIEVEKNQ